MNRVCKNILYTLITIVVIFVFSYTIGSCSMVFNGYQVKPDIYDHVYYANSDTYYLYFENMDVVFLFEKEDIISCDVSYKERFLFIKNEDEKIDYKFFVISDDNLYCQKKNCYFTKVVVNYEN